MNGILWYETFSTSKTRLDRSFLEHEWGERVFIRVNEGMVEMVRPNGRHVTPVHSR